MFVCLCVYELVCLFVFCGCLRVFVFVCICFHVFVFVFECTSALSMLLPSNTVNGEAELKFKKKSLKQVSINHQ